MPDALFTEMPPPLTLPNPPPDPNTRNGWPLLAVAVTGAFLIVIFICLDGRGRYGGMVFPMILVLGIVLSVMWTVSGYRRARPIRRQLREQVLARPDCAELWGSDPLRRKIAAAVTRALAAEFGWPPDAADRFIPDDPMPLLTYRAQPDASDIIAVAFEVERATGHKIRWPARDAPSILSTFVDAFLPLTNNDSGVTGQNRMTPPPNSN